MRKFLAKVAGAGVMFLFAATVALAAPGYSLFGDASYVMPGNASLRAVQLVSDADPGYGGVDFGVTDGMTFADLDVLSTDFNVTEGGCGGGAPRFQVNVVENGVDKNIFVYLGDAPNYTCTPDVWQNSGDLLESGKTVDTSQLSGGTFYHSYDDAVAAFGSLEVTGVQLVTDAGWMFNNNQVVLVDNTVIDDATYTYEPSREEAKESCKKGGYQNYTGENGMPGPFKNQGQCVSYFNHAL